MKRQFVVNWHILEECNFDCRYCFAHWPTVAKTSPEIWKCPQLWEKLLVELRQLPAHVPGEWDGIRLNIAGGEPMLLWKNGYLNDILNCAYDMGFKLSIISNGFLMNKKFIETWAPKMQIIGISMDSADVDTNKRIGRCTKSKSEKQISIAQIVEIFGLARWFNSSVECKLNTVVNTENWRENFNSAIKQIAPDRWKIFKMLPIADTPEISAKQSPFKITDEQFQYFVSRHHRFKEIMMPEDNDAMTASYMMVDPLGRFYQNKIAGANYKHVVSDPAQEIGVVEAVKQVDFEAEKFHRRYIPVIVSTDNEYRTDK